MANSSPTGATKKEKSCLRQGLIGAGVLFVLMIVFQIWLTYMMDQASEKAHSSILEIDFEKGRTTISEILGNDAFNIQPMNDHRVFGECRYYEWDYGILNAWFIGDPIEEMVILPSWGHLRVNDYTRPLDDFRAKHPNQEELNEILLKFEQIFEDHPEQSKNGFQSSVLTYLNPLSVTGGVETSPPGG